MAKLVQRIQKEQKFSGVANVRVPRRPVSFRKATNHEVIRDAFAKFGQIKLNVQIRIQSADGPYVGFNGAGFTLTAPDEESVKAFPEKLQAAAAKIAEELGMKATRRIVPL
jgi:hypothetical protein